MRVIAKAPAARRRWLPWTVCAMFAIAVAAVGWSRWSAREQRSDGVAAIAAAAQRTAAASRSDGRAVSAQPSLRKASLQDPQDMPSNDPDDLASYFQPGDPEPTGKQVIEALQQAGVRTGLGAFNPPGTSPPLQGLAVPEGYALPEGYVRHHQVTDEGVPIEPMLMFAPDFVLYDRKGRPIAMPPDRVVPPELAPPGMPLRPIRIPPR
ncbi:hypothetical protein [Lysobacter silvisoli]|uniref:Uncharacterized protein n=1 Tax=Lysobacter silvisoli TaxID=2293254 RepID=A0A371K407_9GAMM|nr:hypothetical protein [Lysobacter silvisoli]RDZ28666.1 hypothetical protein DX914_05940 [Lysobacter silvisoli]